MITVTVLALPIVGCGRDGSDGLPPPTSAPSATTATSTTPEFGSPDDSIPALPGTIDPPPGADPVVPTRPWVLANRGAPDEAPEHTFAAYDRAIADGADFLKLDLQLTRDGELVILNDPTLDRTARGPVENCRGLIANRTLAQLRTCDVGSWFNAANPGAADPAFVGLRIPTLLEVFERYGTAHRYAIEITANDEDRVMERRLVDALQRGGFTSVSPAAQQIVVQSFEVPPLKAMQRLRPDLHLEMLLPDLASPPDAKRLRGISYYAKSIAPYAADVDASLVAGAHAYCLAVHPYVVDAGPEMTRLLEAGVDGIYTNRPATLAALAEGRTRTTCR